ncbi:hypothetical protein HPB49_014430 [Dermacentor silvarum]|uniref:Uncharacterized protein n=1 Tax=Dermacentor silvarum TaxID=543639 RepID=A0ACB8CLB8_DERSI|nr:hypothetical protein HPB49_014430 [Dermacentor silvarum]
MRQTGRSREIRVSHTCGNTKYAIRVSHTRYGEANPDAQHRCDPKCKLCRGDHLTAAQECKRRFQTPYLVRRRRGERSRALKDVNQAGKHRFNADLPAAAPGTGRDLGLSASTRCGRQPTFVWADLVGPKPGANTGAAPAPRNDPPPEQARDAEFIRLRKENDDLKDTINRLVNEMAEIKKLVSNASGNDAAVRASETPTPAPVDGTATSSKRRAVVNQTCESGVLSAEVSEIKQTLTALANSLKQVAPSVTFLTDSVREVEVVLRDPKRGLGALEDRIDAIEARMASPATIIQPLLNEAIDLSIPSALRQKVPFFAQP